MTAPRTLFDKLWDAHVVVPETDAAPAVLYIDLHLIHEVTSPQAFTELKARGLSPRRPDRTKATMDHSTPTLPADADGKLPYASKASEAQVAMLAKNCAEYGIELFDMASSNRGIVHVIAPEQGFTQPGMTIVCGDSHTSTHGAFGALAFGIGTSEVGHVLATQCLLQRRPKTMAIETAATERSRSCRTAPEKPLQTTPQASPVDRSRGPNCSRPKPRISQIATAKSAAASPNTNASAIAGATTRPEPSRMAPASRPPKTADNGPIIGETEAASRYWSTSTVNGMPAPSAANCSRFRLRAASSSTYSQICQPPLTSDSPTSTAMPATSASRSASQTITIRCRAKRSRIGLTKGPTTEKGSITSAITAAIAHALGWFCGLKSR